jgi:hypothetical protein
MNKLIIIDSSVIAHKAIFTYGLMLRANKAGFAMKPDYTYFQVILSILRRVKVSEGDTVLFALDGRRSWRKAFLNSYKGNREANRNSFPEIKWDEEYARIERFNYQLEEATNWQFLQLSDCLTMMELCQTVQGNKFEINNGTYELDDTFGIEADDIIAVCPKVFKDKEIVIVSIDKDLDMLTYYPNVKIFSLTIKHAGKKGFYKPVTDPLKVLADKVRKGDIGDNILSSKEDTIQDADLRNFIIDLLSLPSFVESMITQRLEALVPKKMNYELLPFSNSLGNPENFDAIYSSKNEVTWEHSMIVHQKKTKKKPKKIKV